MPPMKVQAVLASGRLLLASAIWLGVASLFSMAARFTRRCFPPTR
jgi:hypothetical protein